MAREDTITAISDVDGIASASTGQSSCRAENGEAQLGDDATHRSRIPKQELELDKMFGQGEKTFRTLGKWDTVFVLVANQIGLGILSLPSCLMVLGIIPGIIAVIGLGLLSAYTAYELLQFYRLHPHVLNIVDMCEVVGGRPLRLVAGTALMIKLVMTCASATVTLSISFNTISNHALCTVSFITIAAVLCFILCLPRTVKAVSRSGVPSTVSVLAAAMIVMISLGIASPRDAPNNWTRNIFLVGQPTFREAVNACLKICYAYAGNISFVSYMAEMIDPSRDFPSALAYLEVFSITIYTIIAIVIYCLAGDWTASPALGSAPKLAAKIAYGVVLPAVFATAMAFGHTGIKYMYVVAMRLKRLKGKEGEATESTLKSWILWVACVLVYWIIVWVISNAIPVFDSILAISSATTIAWFTFGFSAMFWFHMNWGNLTKDWKKIALAVINGLMIVQSIFMNAGGLWSAITELLATFESDDGKIRGPFSCGDNAL